LEGKPNTTRRSEIVCLFVNMCRCGTGARRILGRSRMLLSPRLHRPHSVVARLQISKENAIREIRACLRASKPKGCPPPPAKGRRDAQLSVARGLSDWNPMDAQSPGVGGSWPTYICWLPSSRTGGLVRLMLRLLRDWYISCISLNFLSSKFTGQSLSEWPPLVRLI
jgi:hypothetical protein